MINKKISLPIALIMTTAGIGISYIATTAFNHSKSIEPILERDNQFCNNYSTRLKGYEFVSPLLFGEQSCESPKLQTVKLQLEDIIEKYKSEGVIQNASVYIRKLNQGEWISIGDAEKYNPGSLLKVPELICFFKMKEKDPEILNKKITYSVALNLPKQATIVSKSIELGKTYTIRELLYYMIAYSDNYATMLLNFQMDMDVFKKVFTDMGLSQPNVNSNDIPITAKQYSYFMRTLYNASYLSAEDSEYCTELLSHSDFKDGMLNGLPKDIKVVHKFGEAGDGMNAHFNETGIIYVNKSPYLLTVMTKGKNNSLLPGVVSNISKTVYYMIASS